MAAAVSPIVVCPLLCEHRGLERTGLGTSVDLQCCGPGAPAVSRWAEEVGTTSAPVVMAGFAGGLTPTLAAGTAHVVTEVRGGDGTRWTPTLCSASAGWPARIITSVDSPVGSVAGKLDLGRRSGAHLVDLESAAFAAAAAAHRWRWGIVRGISDDARTELPEQSSRWIDGWGRPRPFHVALDAIRRPRLVGVLRQLRRDAQSALPAVAHAIGALLDTAAAEASPESAPP